MASHHLLAAQQSGSLRKAPRPRQQCGCLPRHSRLLRPETVSLSLSTALSTGIQAPTYVLYQLRDARDRRLALSGETPHPQVRPSIAPPIICVTSRRHPCLYYLRYCPVRARGIPVVGVVERRIDVIGGSRDPAPGISQRRVRRFRGHPCEKGRDIVVAVMSSSFGRLERSNSCSTSLSAPGPDGTIGVAVGAAAIRCFARACAATIAQKILVVRCLATRRSCGLFVDPEHPQALSLAVAIRTIPAGAYGMHVDLELIDEGGLSTTRCREASGRNDHIAPLSAHRLPFGRIRPLLLSARISDPPSRRRKRDPDCGAQSARLSR